MWLEEARRMNEGRVTEADAPAQHLDAEQFMGRRLFENDLEQRLVAADRHLVGVDAKQGIILVFHGISPSMGLKKGPAAAAGGKRPPDKSACRGRFHRKIGRAHV